MTREDTIAELQAIAQALDDRVEIWVSVIEMEGSVSQRIYQGSFVSPRRANDAPDVSEVRGE